MPRKLSAVSETPAQTIATATQGLYLAEHRRQPHMREVIFQFIGGKR